MTLLLNASWEPVPEGVSAPELAATWGSCEIRASGRVVTLVEDIATGLTRRHVLGSLYPLAEWIAFNWWALIGDDRAADVVTQSGRLPNELDTAAIAHRHCVASAGDGFAWPALWIAPGQPDAILRWDPTDGNGRVRFLSSGWARVDNDQVGNTLSRFVEQVADRLDDVGIRDTTLQREWSVIKGTDPEEMEFCRAAARLGMDPYDIESGLAATIAAASDLLDTQDFDLLMASANPGRLQSDLVWIEEADAALAAQLAPSLHVAKLRSAYLSTPHQLSVTAPWQTGYDGARFIRTELGAGPSEPLDLSGLVPMTDLPSPDAGLIALVGFRDDQAGAVLGKSRNPGGRRFVQARALWRVISEPASNNRMLIGNGRTLHSQAERAFAAELLAPAQAISEALASGQEDTGSIAELFGVQSAVVELQRNNQLSRSPYFESF